MNTRLTRRGFIALTAGTTAAVRMRTGRSAPESSSVLTEFDYGAVSITSAPHDAQLRETHEVLMNLSEDSLLKPFRQMAGLPAPGADLGGWYNFDPNFDWHKDDAGFAPGATFGQWVSALARYCAITGSEQTRAKVQRLNGLYAQTISERFYDSNRFPAYCYDKLVLGLIDSQRWAGDTQAAEALQRTTRAAVPHMPDRAIDRELEWRPGKDQSYRWDESYTNPENLFIAYQRGAGAQYRELAVRYLDDPSWFDPLSRGENVLAGKHAYSYVNSLSSALQAYLILGSQKHLLAARNAFDMLRRQSYATGGWGPDEMLVAEQGDTLHASLSKTHNSFETPCGSYAHFKAARYLLRVTHDSRYGDSMEQVMYNTVLGVKPMQADGRAFYYADYNFAGRKVYSNHGFPCCSGTLPQVAADYRINTYFRDPGGVYVNLYLPGSAHWDQNGTPVQIAQFGDYPFDDHVSFEVSPAAPQEFQVHLRIPEWSQGARIEVNGKRWPGAPIAGQFASVSRQWRRGDRIDLQLPRVSRVQAISAQNPNCVAVMNGPLVLFPVTDSVPRVTRKQLLDIRRSAKRAWEATTASGRLTFLPYTDIGDEEYSTYLQVS